MFLSVCSAETKYVIPATLPSDNGSMLEPVQRHIRIMRMNVCVFSIDALLDSSLSEYESLFFARTVV